MPPSAEVKQPETRKVQRVGRQFTFWAGGELAHALDSFMESLPYETTYKNHFQNALQEYLKAQGFWPPKDDA